MKEYVAEQCARPGDLRFADSQVDESMISHLKRVATYEHDLQQRCSAISMLMQVDGAIPVANVTDDELRKPSKHYIGNLYPFTHNSDSSLAVFLEGGDETKETKTLHYHTNYLRLNSNGWWTALYRDGKVETVYVRSKDAPRWMYLYLYQLDQHSSPSANAFCGYFMIPNDMKQQLKSLKTTSLEKYPIERICEKPAYQVHSFRDRTIESLVLRAREAMYENEIGSMAVLYLRTLRALSEEKYLTAVGALATVAFPPMSWLVATSLADRKITLTMIQMLHEKLQKALDKETMRKVEGMKYTKPDLEQLAQLFEQLGMNEDASSVKRSIDLLESQ